MSSPQEIGLTTEDRNVFKRLARITRGAVVLHADDRRADCQRADRYDASLMRRLSQWRGSSLQSHRPIAKQIACWDFLGRNT